MKEFTFNASLGKKSAISLDPEDWLARSESYLSGGLELHANIGCCKMNELHGYDIVCPRRAGCLRAVRDW